MSAIDPSELLSITSRREGGGRFRPGYEKKDSERYPLISIVTVVYNGADVLEKTIQSVLSQTYRNIEYIIVDGGSSDGTLDIIRNYDQSIDYWVSAPDKGISDAFNKGLRASSGDWVLFLNAADRFMADDVLERMSVHFNAWKLITGFARYGRTTIPYRAVGNEDPLKTRALISHQATIVHRSVFDTYGMFDERFKIRMDYDFWLRVLKHVKFKFMNDIIVRYAEGGASTKSMISFYIEEMRANKKNLGSCNVLSLRKIQNVFYAVKDHLHDRTATKHEP